MSRSKIKPVKDMTLSELASEKQRCQTLITVYGNKVSSKLLQKRLHEIEKRIESNE